MKALLDAIAATAADTTRQALPGAEVTAVTLLPTGADPFAGTPRPLLYGAVRLAAASPAGVLIGGGPDAMAELLGFTLPPRDVDEAEEDAEEEWDAAPEGDATEPPDDEYDEEEEPPSWSELLADAADEPITSLGTAIAAAIAAMVDLPADVAHGGVHLTDHPRREVGALPYAISLDLAGSNGDQIRIVTIVSGIVLARLGVPSRSDDDAQPAQPADLTIDGSASIGSHGLSGAAGRFANMPLSLTLHMGTTHMPVSEVMALRDGDVLELDAAVDDPVALVAGESALVHGNLEVDDKGGLVLHVTGIPGRGEA